MRFLAATGLLLTCLALGTDAAGGALAAPKPGLPSAVVRGRVVDSTGSPVPGRP